MPNLPISQLPQSTTLQGDELFVNVQGGVTKYTTLDNIAGHHSAHLSCYSTQSQAIPTSGSIQPVTFTDVWTQDRVNIVDNTKITFQDAGVYQFNFVAQVTNSDNAVHSTWFWIKYNGNNFPNSTTQITLNPRKNSDAPSAQLMTMNIIGRAQNDNDFIELYWTGNSTTIQLTESPAFGEVPETPSIIASISRIG